MKVMSTNVYRCNCSLAVLSLYLLLVVVDSANILAIFPTASYSHQMPMLSLTRALAQAGHNLTVITPNPFRTPIPNYTEIDISFTYDYWKPKSSDGKQLISLQWKMTGLELMRSFIKGSNELTDVTLASPNVQEFIKYLDREKPKFDLVLYEDLMHPAFLGFLYKVGHPPMVSIITLPQLCSIDMASGNDCNPSYVPDMVFSTTNKMNFWGRLRNFVLIAIMRLKYVPEIFKVHDVIAKKYFGEGCPSTQSMNQNRSLHLSSSSWLFEYPRPVFPNTIHVGPLHIESTKPLSQDLNNWINGAKNGVVYFSFGSNVKPTLLNSATRSEILAAFAKFPDHRIIWKWDDERIEGLPSNVLCKKWLPQQDILANPNIKLFITQGGLQSLQEGVHYEVPMIGIPFFGDQNYNVRIISRLGIGYHFEFEDISTETLYKYMHEILYNDRYMKAVKRASLLSRTQMMSPRDTAVWWVEYVLKANGNVNHLRPEYWHLSWYQYMGLDVLLTLLSPVMLVLYILYKLISILSRKLSKTKLKKS